MEPRFQGMAKTGYVYQTIICCYSYLWRCKSWLEYELNMHTSRLYKFNPYILIQAAGLHFRGQRIYHAAMDELMSKGMRNANQVITISWWFSVAFSLHSLSANYCMRLVVQVLLAGCSAGGLAVILHCDRFRGLFPSSTRVKCLSDGGLFMDV